MKSQGSKSQFYRYSLKTVATTNVGICTHRIMLYPTPPQDALTIENLNTHVMLTFDSAIASADRVLKRIGIVSEWPTFLTEPRYIRMVDVNIAADASRNIDLNIDLSTLLNRENVEYDSGILGNYAQNNMTMVMLEFTSTLSNTGVVGTINLWKIDALFTTKEIR